MPAACLSHLLHHTAAFHAVLSSVQVFSCLLTEPEAAGLCQPAALCHKPPEPTVNSFQLALPSVVKLSWTTTWDRPKEQLQIHVYSKVRSLHTEYRENSDLGSDDTAQTQSGKDDLSQASHLSRTSTLSAKRRGTRLGTQERTIFSKPCWCARTKTPRKVRFCQSLYIDVYQLETRLC